MKQDLVTIKVTKTARKLLNTFAATKGSKQYEELEEILKEKSKEISQLPSESPV